MPRILLWSSAVCLLALSADDRKLLQDAGGWEYVVISDVDGGLQTEHTCFDGHPHPDACSGNLTLTADNHFTQTVRVHNTPVSRHGTYRLSDSQITFYDEFGTADGPYQLTLDARAKRLTLRMQAVRMELQLEKEYRRQLAANGDRSK